MASSKVVLEGAGDSDAAALKSAAHVMHTGVECVVVSVLSLIVLLYVCFNFANQQCFPFPPRFMVLGYEMVQVQFYGYEHIAKVGSCGPLTWTVFNREVGGGKGILLFNLQFSPAKPHGRARCHAGTLG